LMSLQADAPEPPTPSGLGRLWLPWTIYTGELAAPLQHIAHTLQTAADAEGLFSAEYRINHLLLQATAQPMIVHAAQAMAAAESMPPTAASYGKADRLPLAAVCCGPNPPGLLQPLASQLVQSLAIQVTVMGQELERCGLLSPRWVVPQVLAMVRVLNNMLLAQESGAALSLGFAVAIPQSVAIPPDQDKSHIGHDVYLFTIGNCFAYQRWESGWRRFAPLTSPTSFLGDSSDRLQGQIMRLTVDRDQELLLSTYPLDEFLSRQNTDAAAAEMESTDVAAVAQWVGYKTAAKSSEAIALLRHQREPVSPPVSPSERSETTAPMSTDIELKPAELKSPELESPEPKISEPAPQLPTPTGNHDDSSDRGASFEDLDRSLNVAGADIDDSIGSYLDAEVQAPQPVSNMILDQDIDWGLSTLLPESPPEPLPPSEPIPTENPRRPSTERSASVSPMRSSKPKRQKSRRKPVAQRSVSKRRADSRRIDQKRAHSKRMSKRRTSRGYTGQKAGQPWLLLTLILLLIAAAGVAGTAVWQQRDTEPIQRWLPQEKR
ncbi:MAG: hypothetical protein WBA10_09895, partial [Elainellaceae cyanobacterium]